MSMIDAIAGVIGVFLFEALRVYKCVVANKNPVPGKRYGWYGSSLIGLAVGGGVLGTYLASGNFLLGVYVGFSLPTGLAAILRSEARGNGAKVEDMWPNGNRDAEDLSFGSKLWRWVKGYFGQW
jgi:hypothetical protein